jgi:hypothetical protein
MLEHLSLSNWSCHAALDLPLGPVTVLVGDNDAGKSAVLAALEWALLNQWPGEAGGYVTWGHDQCEVRVQVDGHALTRSRVKGTNAYSLDGQTFKAFGTGIPDPVKALLNVRGANFQGQDDPLYWLALNGGQAASALNQIFHLGEIDPVLARANQEVRQTRAAQDVSEARLATAKREAHELGWAEAADDLLSEAERVGEEAALAFERQEVLENNLAWLEDGEASVAYLEAGVALLERVLNAHQAAATRQRRLAQLTYQLDLENKACQLEARIRDRQGQLNKALAGRCPLCGRGPSKA